MNISTYKLPMVLSLSLLLAACGSDSSDTGSLNINITDGPIDSAQKVVISFSGITIKPQEGPAYDIDFTDENGNPVTKKIDLLSLQGANSEPLLTNESLTAGHYNWLRLKVITSKTSTDDSYIEIDGAVYPLYVPSGNETGLKMNHSFDISVSGSQSFTIDFDLRKSIIEPSNSSLAYKLKPTLRIVSNDIVGHIDGHIGTGSTSSCSGVDGGYSVYAFSGENITADDIDGQDAEPVTTSLVSEDTFNYEIGFLDAGIYTLAFTCQSASDDPESNDDIVFIGSTNITVIAGDTITYNFD